MEILKPHLKNEKSIRILFKSMDSQSKGYVPWNEFVNFTLHELTTSYSAETLVCILYYIIHICIYI